MRDQNTRATLIEAVIAGGLIAVGVAKSLPPTKRDPTGQDALESILYSVRDQLSEMQNTLDKTYTATMDIKTTLDEIAPVLQGTV